MLSGISVICFAASYLVALVLDISRLFVRVAARTAIMLGFLAAGGFAQAVFLFYRVQELARGDQPLLNWYIGCLGLAWLLVVVHLASLAVSRQSSAGLILLPASLTLIGMAHVFPRTPSSVLWWSHLHGWALLIGMVLIAVGFAAGILYLLQSSRLKRPRTNIRPLLWLPSLEWLQRWNERCLLASLAFVGWGLISGILLNVVRTGESSRIPWSDPVVLASLIWLAWILLVAIFSGIYKPARQGRKVAYLTTGSFVFLALVMAIMWGVPNQHAATTAPSEGSSGDRVARPLDNASSSTERMSG